MIASVRGCVLAVSRQRSSSSRSAESASPCRSPRSTRSLLRIGQEASLHTALIVREDDLSLFGFETRAELEVFDLLRGVSGVGPKSALGVLATLSPDDIARAVAAEDDAPFRKVSGIGPKTAKLIAVSLQGKLLAPAAASVARRPPGGRRHHPERRHRARRPRLERARRRRRRRRGRRRGDRRRARDGRRAAAARRWRDSGRGSARERR